MFVSKHVYVVNLDPAVMTLKFGASIDNHDTVRYNRTRWRISLLGPRPYSLIASSYIPHRIVDINASPKCQCHHRRVKVNDIDMFRNKHFFFSMVLEKVSQKQSREHWLRIPYGVERRVRVELKSVKIIIVYNLCFHFNSNNLFRFFNFFLSGMVN